MYDAGESKISAGQSRSLVILCWNGEDCFQVIENPWVRSSPSLNDSAAFQKCDRSLDPAMPIPPETQRLIFRDWTPADLEPFHNVCSDSSVMLFVGNGKPWLLEMTRQFIERAMEMSQTLGFCQWPLIHKSDSALIGFCGFVPSSNGAEIGWRLANEYWGQGLATEAATAVLKHGFETLGFPRIVATVQSPNHASIRVIEKLGMLPESAMSRDGREVVLYSINRNDSEFRERHFDRSRSHR